MGPWPPVGMKITDRPAIDTSMISGVSWRAAHFAQAHPLLYNHDMKKVLLLALSLPLAACVVGADGSPTTGGGDDTGGSNTGSNTGSGGGSGGGGGGISGAISADTTWTGTVNLLGAVTISPGVTLTVAPGTTVKSGVTGDANITVNGTLLEQGAKGTLVTFNSVGVNVSKGGTLTATYAVHTGGGIETVTGGTVTLTDSVLSHAGGDFLVMSGGTVTMDYSQIGVGLPTDAARGADTTHCDMHFNATAGSVIKITNSNVASSSYGIMLYASNADLSNNNWYGNTNDFEPAVTGVTGGKADGGYFKNGMPAGVQGVTFANLSTTPLVAGPR